MDLTAIKQKRLEDVKAIIRGDIKLPNDIRDVLIRYGKNPDKLFPQQVLTLLKYDAEQVELIMKCLIDKTFIAPQPGSQETFLNTSADIVLYGGAAGSGKTAALLMDSLQHIEDPDYKAVYFRRNTTQLRGGLWPAAKKLFGMFGGVPKEQSLEIHFPSGANITFAYMELDKHKDAHQGIEYSAIYWDEFTHYDAAQVQYLMTRMRSGADGDSYMKCSMNPDRDHFVYAWVEPYLDDDGYPDPEKCGRLRYYVMDNNVMVSYWTIDELYENYPLEIPQTYTFIQGTIDDNPILDFIEPKYRGKLENNSPVTVARLRYGNWKARAEGSNYFQRNWCEIVDTVPPNCISVRAWDLAATLPSEVNPNPDWTAGVKMLKCKDDGCYYIAHAERFRDRPSGVEDKILTTAAHDSNKTSVFVPQDPGAAGKSYATSLIRKLAEQGFRARAKPTNKDKVTRFAPFSSAAEAGIVKILRGTWNDAFLTELEGFTGEGNQKDDQVDATSDAFISLNETKFIKPPTMGANSDMMRTNPYKGLRN
ncbi:terminase large subunit [Yersinia phage vB_YenM_P778]